MKDERTEKKELGRSGERREKERKRFDWRPNTLKKGSENMEEGRSYKSEGGKELPN